MFEGAWVALVTPFREGRVDLEGLEALVEFQVDQKIDGLLACGTTGETPALSEEEHAEVAERVIRAAKGRVPVMVGTGSNNLEKTIRSTRAAAEMKADGALVVTPYYNKPSQEGLYRFYVRVASEVDIPIVLYNVPGRTGVNLQAETALRLSEIRNVVAVKEASGNLSQIEQIVTGGLPVLSGDDGLTYPILSLGGLGVISVLANIVPGEVAAMCRSYREGDHESALAAHRRLTPLAKALFIESNPVPVKAALRMMGKGNGEVRLPLAPMAQANEEKLREVVAAAGLIPRR